MGEKEVQELWGSVDDYFRELRKFYNAHSRGEGGANLIVYEDGVPSKAVYFFRPYQVWMEREILLADLSSTKD